RLAGAVRPDQAHDLTSLERQIDAVDGPNALEVDVDSLRDQLLVARTVDNRRHLRSTGARRRPGARAAVADVGDRLQLPAVDLLVLSVRPLLDRVHRRLWPVALVGELHV